MAYNAEQHRAIQHYCDQNNAVPQLSVFPKVRFKLKDTGEFKEVSIYNLVQEHKRAKKA